jgi:hypothetical protein
VSTLCNHLYFLEKYFIVFKAYFFTFKAHKKYLFSKYLAPKNTFPIDDEEEEGEWEDRFLYGI